VPLQSSLAQEQVVAELGAARARSEALLAPLTDDQLLGQHSPLMSPLVWDLAHVANYEDLWLVRALGAPAVRSEIDDIYDAFRHPRRERPSLPILGPSEARSYARAVRDRALEVLSNPNAGAAEDLLREAFVYGMVVQHEHQHDETMLATLQLMDSGDPYASLAPALAGGPQPVPDGPRRATVVAGGTFVMGTDTDPWAYDNERPAHVVEVPTFRIAAHPVTNAEYLAFVEEGGYDNAGLWGGAGWEHRQAAGLEHPQFWRREGEGSWSVLRFGRRMPLAPDEPVQHVCWHEADAYARWAGARLPTEAEWEKAAHAGVLAHRREVWEWTASDFVAHPGFRSFPYREYSEVFYGPEYKVLRGGSWATHPTAIRNTFRNWDYPIRRQIFSGLRLCWDEQ
jgi:gamma-glutamyl hercynylcysteine S-oxide synthase